MNEQYIGVDPLRKVNDTNHSSTHHVSTEPDIDVYSARREIAASFLIKFELIIWSRGIQRELDLQRRYTEARL